MTPSFHWLSCVSGMTWSCFGPHLAGLLRCASALSETGANLSYLSNTPVGAVNDVMLEAHGKLVKRDWYRTRRGTLKGVPGDGTVACMQFDNLHMACIMAKVCSKQ